MPAAAGATRIPVAPLSASLPAGAVLNFSQAKAVLIAEAPAGATSLEVRPLGAALPSGAIVSWSGEMLVRSQALTRIALAQPLTSAIPEGAVLAFPSGNVILAQEAAAGSLYLYAHPVEQPTVGAIASYSQELLQLPYSKKLVARGGMVVGGFGIHYPYQIDRPLLLTSGGVTVGGSAVRVLDGSSGGEISPQLFGIGGAIAGGSGQLSYLFTSGGIVIGGNANASLPLFGRGGTLVGGGGRALREFCGRGGTVTGGSGRTTYLFSSGGILTGGSGGFVLPQSSSDLEVWMFGDWSNLESMMG